MWNVGYRGGSAWRDDGTPAAHHDGVPWARPAHLVHSWWPAAHRPLHDHWSRQPGNLLTFYHPTVNTSAFCSTSCHLKETKLSNSYSCTYGSYTQNFECKKCLQIATTPRKTYKLAYEVDWCSYLQEIIIVRIVFIDFWRLFISLFSFEPCWKRK